MSFRPTPVLSPRWRSLFKPHGNSGCSRAAIIAAISAREDPDSSSSDGVSRAVILDELGDVSEHVLDIALKGAVKYGKLIKSGDSYKVAVVTAEERQRQKEAQKANRSPFVTKGQSMFASSKNLSAYSPVCDAVIRLPTATKTVRWPYTGWQGSRCCSVTVMAGTRLPPVPYAGLLCGMPCYLVIKMGLMRQLARRQTHAESPSASASSTVTTAGANTNAFVVWCSFNF